MAKNGIGWKSKLLLALLWINFAFFWIRIYRNTGASDYKNSMSYLTILGLLYGMVVTLWIVHNIRIYRKKGPRRMVRIVNFTSTVDALRNQIRFRTSPKRTQEIMIAVVNGEKIFGDGLIRSGNVLPPGNLA